MTPECKKHSGFLKSMKIFFTLFSNKLDIYGNKCYHICSMYNIVPNIKFT